MEGCKCYIYNNGHKQSQQIKMIGCQCYLQLLFCNLYFLNISTQKKLSNTYLKNTRNIKICMIECIPILLIVNYQSSHKLAGKKAQLIKVQAQELDFRSPGSTAKQGAVACPCNSSTVRVLRGGSQRFIGQPSQTGKLWI